MMGRCVCFVELFRYCVRVFQDLGPVTNMVILCFSVMGYLLGQPGCSTHTSPLTSEENRSENKSMPNIFNNLHGDLSTQAGVENPA
jgi:hypothetical protein